MPKTSFQATAEGLPNIHLLKTPAIIGEAVKNITSLPFVRDATQADKDAGFLPRIFWSVKASGDWEYDCQTGDDFARLAMGYMLKQDFAPLLGWAVADMMRSGASPSGIETGFVTFFARKAMTNERHALRGQS